MFSAIQRYKIVLLLVFHFFLRRLSNYIEQYVLPRLMDIITSLIPSQMVTLLLVYTEVNPSCHLLSGFMLVCLLDLFKQILNWKK